MRIADSLRQECMPEMVFSICKMALIQNDREMIQRAITLNHNDKNSQEQFNQVFKFACACEFITDQNGKVRCELDNSKLETFSQFRMQVANGVFKDQTTNFTKIAEWYMNKEDYYIFSQDSGQALAAYISDELKINVDRFYALGFRFWMVDLGFLSFQNYRRGAVLFSCHNYLRQWLEEQKFERNVYLPVRLVIDQLISDCPLFGTMIHNNHLNMAFSMAMRVLRSAGYIDIRRVKDSGDVWHIKDSDIDPWIISSQDVNSGYKNEFSELMILEA